MSKKKKNLWLKPGKKKDRIVDNKTPHVYPKVLITSAESLLKELEQNSKNEPEFKYTITLYNDTRPHF